MSDRLARPWASETTAAPVAIFGGKGGGEVVAEYLAARGMSERVLGFLNDGQPSGTRIAGYKVLGRFADWSGLPSDVLFNAPLHKVKESQQRSAIVEALGIPDDRWANLLHPRCDVPVRPSSGRGRASGPSATCSRACASGAMSGCEAGSISGMTRRSATLPSLPAECRWAGIPGSGGERLSA